MNRSSTPPEEARIWRQFVPAWKQYIKEHEEFLVLAKAYQRDTSNMVLYNKMCDFTLFEITKSYWGARSLLDQLVEINEEEANRVVASAKKDVSLVNTAAISLIIAGVLIAVILALYIIRSVLQDVGG